VSVCAQLAVDRIGDHALETPPGLEGLCPRLAYLDSGLETALDLANKGFAVFPVDSPKLVEHCAGIGAGHHPSSCTERGKHPCVKWGEAASTDPKALAAWFTGPLRNIGIACGPGPRRPR